LPDQNIMSSVHREKELNKFATGMERTLRVLVAPDSFKGSVEAAEVAARIAAGVRRAMPSSTVIEAPIADGGEGTAAAVNLALGGAWHTVAVIDANGKLTDLPFSACSSAELGKFAIFDVAEVVGLPDAVLPPGRRTTRGIGQAIRAIADLGYKTIALGLGGSSTNDGGAGMLAELAFQFIDANGVSFYPVFDTLSHIHAMVRRDDADWIRDVRLIGLTDVTSPLAGPNGASMIFGAQKGFDDLEYADRILRDFGRRCETLLNAGLTELEGAGAAGGIGFGLCSIGGELVQGGAFILDALRLTQDVDLYDWIITGEGRSDRQTLLGKGPALVARVARERGVPVTLLSGAIEYDESLEAAFDGCFSVQAGPVSLDYAMCNAGDLLEAAGRQLATMFAAVSRRA
jgi:glycerate kinase